MALPVDDGPLWDGPLWSRPRALLALLRPSPGRWEFAVRQGLICALTALAVSLYQTPEAALTVYMVFFLNKPDRASSLLTNVVMVLLMSVIIATVMAIARAVIDQPIWRVASIASLSFAMLFLASASKLRPVGATVALISGYALDSLGSVHAGEIATRALLYAWLFAAIPAGLSIMVNLLIAPAPRRLAEQELAEQLEVGAAVLRSVDPDASARFEARRWQGSGEISAWLRLSGVEKTTVPRDLAALRHAAGSSTAILLLIDLAVNSLDAALPLAIRTELASVLNDMAAILRAGGYPLEIVPPTCTRTADLTIVQRALLDDLAAALARFADPPTDLVTAPAAKASGGFFLPDAFTNPEHVHYALKTTAAAMLCYGLYTMLDWPGIHTCFITCYIVSLSTAGETAEKLALRVMGCLVGAAAGLAAILFVVPWLTSIGTLMIVVFVGGFAGAWVVGGGPRIAYAGLQIAFAFFICIIQGASPAIDMETIRDRVIGILLGDVVAYLVFVNVWPVSVARSVDAALGALLRGLSALSTTPAGAGRRAAAANLLAAYQAVERNLGLAHYEPDRLRPSPGWLSNRTHMLAEIPGLIGRLLLIGPDRSAIVADALGRRLNALADSLAQAPPAGPAVKADFAASVSDGSASLWSLVDRPLTSLETTVSDGSRQGMEGHA